MCQDSGCGRGQNHGMVCKNNKIFAPGSVFISPDLQEQNHLPNSCEVQATTPGLETIEVSGSKALEIKFNLQGGSL